MILLIALPAPRILQPEITRLQHPDLFPPLRPSRLEPHITLKAPAEVSKSQLAEATETIPVRLAIKGPIKARIEQIGFINSTSLVIFFEPGPFQDVHQDVITGLKADIHEDERFRPHITFGRAGHPVTPAIKKRAQEVYDDDQILGLEAEFNIIRLYARPNNSEAYKPLKDILLTDNS